MLSTPKQKMKAGAILMVVGGILLIFIFVITFLRGGQ